jgi:hypothetical protein
VARELEVALLVTIKMLIYSRFQIIKGLEKSKEIREIKDSQRLKSIEHLQRCNN